MYLGIHWVIDVLAGGVLGVLSVLVASRPRVWRPGRRRHPSTTPAE